LCCRFASFFRFAFIHFVDFFVVFQSVVFAKKSSFNVFDIVHEENQVCESLSIHFVD
jgi:hypothetical protein